MCGSNSSIPKDLAWFVEAADCGVHVERRGDCAAGVVPTCKQRQEVVAAIVVDVARCGAVRPPVR
jgi:hypothetical protein